MYIVGSTSKSKQFKDKEILERYGIRRTSKDPVISMDAGNSY
jgi:hypothetical protein